MMKTQFTNVIVYGLLLAILASYCALQAQSPSRKAINPAVQNTRILNAINDRQNLLRATREPFVVAPPKATACAMFGGFSQKSNPHDGFAVHVYFEKTGRDMMTTGKGTYPVNSLIIKEKLRSEHCYKTHKALVIVTRALVFMKFGLVLFE